MKRLSKILVMLLALAICGSCFAAVISADGEEGSNYDYESVLDYFEAGYFVNEDFNGNANFDTTTGAASTVFQDANDEFSVAYGNKLKYQGGAAEGYFNCVAETVLTATPAKETSFGVNARVKLTSGFTGSTAFRVVLQTDKSTSVNLFNAKVGSVTLPVKSVDETGRIQFPYGDETKTSAINKNGFFTVELFYDWDKGIANLTITPDGGTPEEYTIDVGYYAHPQIMVVFSKAYFDYVEFYKGDFPRRLSGNDDIIAGHLNTLADLYKQNAAQPDAIKYLEVFAKVVGEYGYTTENVTDSALKATTDANMVEALKTIGEVYATNFIADVSGLANVTDYNGKLAYIDNLSKYNALLETIEQNFANNITLSVSAEDIAAARVQFNAAKTWVEDAKANTLATMKAIADMPELFFATYADLRAFHDVYANAPICESYTDETYDANAIAQAINLAASYESRYNVQNAKAEAFFASVPVAADSTKTFAERYAAYIVAQENYFTDATYDAFATTGNVAALIASYAAAEAELVPVANYAEDFISKVDEAVSSLSYSVKNVALTEAAVYLETVERSYPGVAEAIEAYNATLADVSAKIAATEAYITAVIAVRDAVDADAKLAAIDAAKALEADGSDVSVVVTVDGVTVTDANIILSTAEKEIESSGIRNIKYSEAVAAIASASDLLAKREAIFAATALRDKADAEDDAVVAANAKLAAEIAAYNAAVDAANSAADECNGAAANAVTKTVIAKTAAEIIAIIKKYFEI